MITAPSTRVIAEVMTRAVHVATPLTSLRTVARLLCENHVGALPVLGADGQLLGIVSASDLLSSIALPSVDADTATAETAMTSPAIVAHPGLPVADAARLMERQRIRHLPVVDSAGRLVGIASRGDLIRLLVA